MVEALAMPAIAPSGAYAADPAPGVGTARAVAALSADSGAGDFATFDLSAADRSLQTAAGGEGAEDPFKRFEAVILTHMLGQAFPQGGEGGLFGDSAADGFYRSMLLDQLGTQLAGSPSSPLAGMFDPVSEAGAAAADALADPEQRAE